MEAERLAALDIVRVRAENPSIYTLTGTNSWVLARDPAWVIDPGPPDPAHLDALVEEIDARGGLGGILLTHHHGDHAEAVPALRARRSAPVAAAAGEEITLADGDRLGPLRAVATPGHVPDHLAFVMPGACFTGDAVLGEGSVFITGDLQGYLAALRRLLAEPLQVICPGHGPPVFSPHAKLEEYIEHRLERERLLVRALDDGARTVDQMLDRAWAEVSPPLRLAAAITLGAHLDKLEHEGRLPAGVERPTVTIPTNLPV
ncbi:MAG TPA: MBL fold metallo-hydrolase [Solirubrobacteraceae bacterium]|jgi:glyoxylase-like metal-dependent hydrolase (beta-lactamase superfamily II)|nr:MBL fold metallo-hydrolase [Solirubrobacteraceae bacterium]